MYLLVSELYMYQNARCNNKKKNATGICWKMLVKLCDKQSNYGAFVSGSETFGQTQRS